MPTEIDLRDKIESLSMADFSIPSEVEVFMDDLASALISKYKLSKRKEFWGRSPSLYQVIAALVEDKLLTKDTISLGREVKYVLREAYGDEGDDETSAELEERISSLQDSLLEQLADE